MLTSALENSDHVVLFAVVFEALNGQAVAFYQRCGFLPFADDGRRLCLLMATVKTLLS